MKISDSLRQHGRRRIYQLATIIVAEFITRAATLRRIDVIRDPRRRLAERLPPPVFRLVAFCRA